MRVSDSVLVVIDVQGNLASLMYDHERLFANIERMIRIAQVLELPILWTEQAPDKIGVTVEPVSRLLFPLIKPIHKRTFSCYPETQFKEAINGLHRHQIILIGIETHVCVFQTARDMKASGYEVYLAEDAVSSKTKENKDSAVNRMRQDGIVIGTVEMFACELLHDADHPRFKEVMINTKR